MTEIIPQLNDFASTWSGAIWRAAWQGGIALGVAWMLPRLTPKIPARVRVWCWRLAFAKLLLTLIWTTPVKLPILPATDSTPRYGATEPVAVFDVEEAISEPSQMASTPATNELVSPDVALSLSAWVLVAWGMGVAIAFAVAMRHWRSVRCLISDSNDINDEQIESVLASLLVRFGISEPVRIRSSADISSPLLAGWLRPVILVPQSFLHEKSPSQLRMMLGHELAHIKRRDLLWAWLGLAARALFFFHPLVMIAKRESRLAEEMACDELAVSTGQFPPLAYAGMLVEVAAGCGRPRQEEWVAGIVGSHQTLRKRLLAMKKIHPLSGWRMTLSAALIAITGLIAIVPWRLVAQQSPDQPVETPQVLTRLFAQRAEPSADQPVQTPAPYIGPKPGTTVSDYHSMVPPPDPNAHPAPAQNHFDAPISVDRDGNYSYSGRVLSLKEAVDEAKIEAATDPARTVFIRADRDTPFQKLVALLDAMKEADLDRVSLSTETVPNARHGADEIILSHDGPLTETVPNTQRPDGVIARLKAQRETEAVLNAHHGSRPAASAGPEPIDIAFGVARPQESTQTGPAAVGQEGDYWNAVCVPWVNDHTESGLKDASHKPSPIQVRMVNLAGGWGNGGQMGVKAPMLDTFNYPVNNQGGNSWVILKNTPPGRYDIYLYGHGPDPLAYGDYTLTVGNRKYPRKTTSNKSDALENKTWVEGSQYVKYIGVEITPGDDLQILIQPGGQVTDHWGRTFSDALINGLQLIPESEITGL